MEKLKNTRILGIVGLSIMLIATFLPYISASVLGITSSVSLFGYWQGKVTLFVIFANILFVFKDYVKKYVPQLFEKGIGKSIENAKPIFSLIPTGISVLLNIVLILQVTSSNSKYTYIDVGFGIGFYVMLLGIASMIAYAILYKEPEQVAEASNTTIVDAPAPAPTDAAQPVAPTPVVPTAEAQVAPVAPETSVAVAPAMPTEQPTPTANPTEPVVTPAPQPVPTAEPAAPVATPAPVEQPIPTAEPVAPVTDPAQTGIDTNNNVQ